MTDYTSLRLEKDGTVVAYFAPSFKVSPLLKNDLKKYPLPRARGQGIRDMRIIVMEVVVQGTFEDSRNLPEDHKDALVALFGQAIVTERDQVNRIQHYANLGGKMKLYVGSDSYTAENLGEQDLEAGIYPTVFIAEVRPPHLSGLTRVEYMVRFDVGFQK